MKRFAPAVALLAIGCSSNQEASDTKLVNDTSVVASAKAAGSDVVYRCAAALNALGRARNKYDRHYEATHRGFTSAAIDLCDFHLCRIGTEAVFLSKTAGHDWYRLASDGDRFSADPKNVFISDPEAGGWYSRWDAEQIGGSKADRFDGELKKAIEYNYG